MPTHAPSITETFTGFLSGRRVARGDLHEVVRTMHPALAPDDRPLIFDDETGAQVDVDLRGPLKIILGHLPSRVQEAPAPAAGRGRPKLGVVAREVTLLPRHWEWLASQPGGASVALRKLVEEARRRETTGPENQRRRKEAAYRFLSAIAGDLPGFEDASRALFAGEEPGFRSIAEAWPEDILHHALELWGKDPAAH